MTLASDLRARSLAAVAILDKLARADLADAPDDGSTVRDARSKKVDAFSALLLLLWGKLQVGSLTMAEYSTQVEAAFDAAVGTVSPAAEETIAALKVKALDRANGFAKSVSVSADNEDAPSEPQKRNWATMAAGALWGAVLAGEAFGRYQPPKPGGRAPGKTETGTGGKPSPGEPVAKEELPFDVGEDEVSWQTQGDDRVCDPCDELDGKTWKLSQGGPPFWPGDPDGPCDGGDNCRCEVS